MIDTIHIVDMICYNDEKLVFRLDNLAFNHSIHIDGIVNTSDSVNIRQLDYLDNYKQKIDCLNISFEYNFNNKDDLNIIDTRNSLQRFLKSNVLQYLNSLTISFYDDSIDYLKWISTLFNDNKFISIHELTINLNIEENSSSEYLTIYENIVEKLIPKASIVTIQDCTINFLNRLIPKGCFHNTTQLILKIKDMSDDNFCKIYTTNNFPQLKSIKFYKDGNKWWNSFIKMICKYIKNNNFPSSSIVRLGNRYANIDYIYDPNYSIFRCKNGSHLFIDTIIGTKDEAMNKYELEELFKYINENKTQDIRSLNIYIYDEEQLSELIMFIIIGKFPKLKEFTFNIGDDISTEQHDIYKQELDSSSFIQENHVHYIFKEIW
ncbi:hypothetical protein WA158_006624 [Blastocystis sp. Blastoise]